MALSYWGTIGTFFTIGGVPIAGHYDRTAVASFSGDVLWVDTVTPSAGYAVGNANPYTIYLTAQDRYGDQQDAVAIGTTTMVFPFVNKAGVATSAAGVAEFSSANGVTAGAAYYWAAGATAGTYDLKWQNLTDTVANLGTASPAIALQGSAVTIFSGVSNLLSWTSNWIATTLLYGYSTTAGAGLANIYLQALNTNGTVSSPLVQVAANVDSGTAWAIGNNGTAVNYVHEDNSAALAAIDIQSFNVTTGALGAATIVGTALNNIEALGTNYVTVAGVTKVFVGAEGTTTGSNDKITVGLYDATTGQQTGAGATFTMSSTAAVHWSITTLTNAQQAVAYQDNGVVHLELLDSSGNQVGSDLIVPGITSYDRIRSLGDGRVEIDYRTNSGDPQALIYDTRTAPITANGTAASETLVGTSYNDVFNGSGGNDRLNGGLGSNTINYATATSGINAVVIGGTGTVVKSGIGTDTITGFGTITGSASTDVFTVDSTEIVNGIGGFDFLIEASASVTLTYGVNFTNIAEVVTNVGTNTINGSTDPNLLLIYGSTGTDTLSLGSGGGYLFSGGGTGNILNGGANAVNILIDSGGTSTMNGGTGTATNYYYVNGTNDTVHGAGAFNAVIYTSNDANYATIAADHVQEVILNGGTNFVSGIGSSDFLYLYGGSGNDTLTAGSAGGYLFGLGGTNTLNGGTGGTNVFVGGGGGSDAMNGGTGASSNIYFVDHLDTVIGAGAFNTVIELEQNVSLTLGGALLGNNVQELVLNGGANTADFSAATSSVYLYGGAGADTLKGGTGNDYLYGQGGLNTFQFQANWGKDVIADFSAGSAGSTIDLVGLAGSGIHTVTDLTQTITTLTVNGNSVISDVITSSVTGANSITLWGVTAPLTASSFHFA